VWRDIYGAFAKEDTFLDNLEDVLDVLNPDEDIEKQMNRHPETGNCWKGRVLFHVQIIDCTKENQPKKQVLATERSVYSSVPKQMTIEKLFIAHLQVGQGLNMPGDKNYSIEVRIRNHKMTSHKPSYKGNRKEGNRYVKWDWNHRGELMMTSLSHDPSNKEYVFFYLLDGEIPIAWAK
jgi:hypothetical protein